MDTPAESAHANPNWLKQRRWPTPQEQRAASPVDLSPLLSEVVDSTWKGFPAVPPMPVSELEKQDWNVARQDLALPLMTLSSDALLNNLDVMSRFCADAGVLLAPHGKTSMAPQLFALQLAAGAWGITVASTQQLAVCARFGVPRVMIANEVVGAANVRALCTTLRQNPSLEVAVWVDSVAGVDELAAGMREHAPERQLQLLLDVGYPGGRTGVRSYELAEAVASAANAHDGCVVLAGVAAFEGLLDVEKLGGTGAAAMTGATVQGYLGDVRDVAERLLRAGLLQNGYLLTGGGSTSFDAVVDTWRGAEGATVILRSGCYITHDHYMNARTSPLGDGNSAHAQEHGPLEAAFRLWSYVTSTPEQGLALLGFGRRDAPFDYGLPVPLGALSTGSGELTPLAGAEVFSMNDQHAYLRHSGDLQVGDRVVLGISHPCTAFDKWRLIPVIDRDGRVVDGIRTYF